MRATVPEAYVGLWRRTLLRAPGKEDTTTRVYWLQTSNWHADIRAPSDRPLLSDYTGLAALSVEEMHALARQQGFAGITEVEGEICRWHRRFDYQPPSGFNDIGRMQFDGPDRLLEYGVEQDYFEIWERVSALARTVGDVRPPTQHDPWTRGGTGSARDRGRRCRTRRPARLRDLVRSSG